MMQRDVSMFVDAFKHDLAMYEQGGSITPRPALGEFEDESHIEQAVFQVSLVAGLAYDTGYLTLEELREVRDRALAHWEARTAAELAQIDEEIAADDAYALHAHDSLVESLSFQRGAAGQYLRVIEGGKGGFTPRTEVTRIDTITYG